MANKLKKGNEVVVIAGDHKGSKGKILEVLREKNRVLVEGVNLVKKHERKTQDNPQGSIVEREASIHLSNVKKASWSTFKSVMNTPELKEVYTKTVVPALMKKLDFVNVHQVPKIEKIVLNSSFGAEMDKNGVKDLKNDIANISGQAPVVVKAKISVSNFKLRQGMPVGVKVTLRGNQMWEFLYRLIAISLPNIRDFRGVRAKLDGNGNYSLGVTDHSIFPEINVERQRVNVGLDICITTTAKNDEEGMELLQLLGMPFRKQASQTTEKAA